MAAELAPLPPKRNRTRSPSYPYLDLPAALEKAAVLWKAEGRHPVAVNLAMQHWGYKEESSTGYSCIAALKKFGLVDHEGMGETRQVRLSNLALTILLDSDPASPERRDALRTAALAPRIHAELWERYGAELPSGQSLRRFLVLERSFNEASVDELLEEYQQSMAFAGLSVGPVRGSAPAPATPVVATAAVAAAEPVTVAGATTPREPVVARRQDVPLASPPERARGVGARGLAWNSAPPAGAVPAASLPPAPAPQAMNVRRGEAAGRQPGLFDAPAGDEEDDAFFSGGVAPAPEEPPAPVPAPVRPAAVQEPREAVSGPWSVASRELPVPLDNGMVARVPYPMTEEDFALLMDTLQLWKKRLVQPQR